MKPDKVRDSAANYLRLDEEHRKAINSINQKIKRDGRAKRSSDHSDGSVPAVRDQQSIESDEEREKP